jgi:hypothetical protein
METESFAGRITELNTTVILSLSLGGYEKGKKSGMGTFKYPDGKQYQGEWFNGHQQGAGKLIKNGETIFDGFFSEGQAVVSTKAASGRGKGLGV